MHLQGKPLSPKILADIMSRHVPAAEKQQRLARAMSAAAIPGSRAAAKVLESARLRLSQASAEAVETSPTIAARRMSLESKPGFAFRPTQGSFQDLEALGLQT